MSNGEGMKPDFVGCSGTTMSSNITFTADDKPPFWFDMLRAVLLFASVFLIITGNIFCILVIRDSTQMRKVSRIFILSLIVADLFAGLFSGVALLVTVAAGQFIPATVQEVLCKLYFIAGILFNGASFMSLLTVILDCYIAVEKPLRYPSLLTARRAYNITLCIWIMVVCGTLTYSCYFGAVPHYKKEWHWCLMDNITLSDESYTLLLVIYLALTVMLPLLVTIVLYSRIRLIVRRHMARIARITPAGHPLNHRSSDSKSLTSFLMVSCGVTLTSLPLSIIMLYSHWTGDYSVYWISAAMVLRSCNNLLNVLVHIRRNKEFRTTASRLLCRWRNRQDESKGNTVPNSTQLTSIATAVAL